MRPLYMRTTMELVLGALVVACLLIILYQSRRVAEYQRHQAADAKTLQALQQALRLKGLEVLPPPAPEQLPLEEDRGSAKKEEVIKRLDRELAENHATIEDLQTQLSTANDQNAKALATAQEQLQKQQADAQAQVEDLKKQLDAALSQADIARQRLAALEADDAKLKTDTAASTAHAADVAHTIAGLQDLDRRREVYLTSILRRYRDITSQFSAMSSMLDTSHDPGANACSGAVLSRIQNAVSSSEDDLRQISEINERVQKLEKQLRKN